MATVTPFLRQPLLHFLAIGVAVFLAYDAVSDRPAERSDASPAETIHVTKERVEQLAASFQAVWRRQPTDSERTALIDDFIREEILVREATALGLDRNDAVVRRRLRQKMEFLTESAAGALEPTDDQLRELLAQNAERYTSDAEIAFDQVYLGEHPTDDEIAAIRAALAAGADPARTGRRSLLPSTMPISHQLAVDGTFGQGFFDQLITIEGTGWSAAVQSGYGLHLVRITERVAPALPDFDSLRGDLVGDWRTQKAHEIAEAQFQNLLANYRIVRADRDAEGAAQ